MTDPPTRPGGPTVNRIEGGVFFHAVVQGRDITVQLPARITPALAGLPAATPSFTGRDEELEALLAALAPGSAEQDAVLVSAVAGLAGVGKTELVLKAARQALEKEGWFPGGVLFVDLFGYDTALRLPPERALNQFLRALGVPVEHIPSELEGLNRLYTSVLAAYAAEGRRVLVVIDNAGSADQVKPLLPTDGRTAALVTSRHTLAGLGARLHDLDVLAPDTAVDLLRRALRQARGGSDTRVDDDPGRAREIAGLCGHLPLALHLVAALLADDPRRPLAAMAEELADTARLDELSRDDLAVRTAFALSYRHLTPEQARMFRLLSLNGGPDISTEAAAHLLGAGQRPTRHLLEGLARGHLIEPAGTYGRWRMHDLVRLYAYEHAHAHSETDQAMRALQRLWTYYRQTAESADRVLAAPPGDRSTAAFPSRAEAVGWLEREHRNVLEAIAFAYTIGHAGFTAALTAAITPFLHRNRYFDEALAAASVTLRALTKTGDPESEAWAREHVGLALLELQRLPEATVEYERAIDIYRALGDRPGEARALDHLGLALRERDEFREDSVRAHRRALSLYRDLGDRRGEARALNNLGLALQRLERFQEAVTAHEQAGVLFTGLGDTVLQRVAIDCRAAALQGLHRFDETVASYRQSIAHYQEMGARDQEGTAWEHLAAALTRLERPREAAQAHGQAAAIWEELKDKRRQATNLKGLGDSLDKAGPGEAAERPEECLAAYREAAELYRQLGDRRNEGRTLNSLGAALGNRDQVEEAITVHHRAADIWKDLGERHGQAVTLDLLGVDLTTAGRLDEAVAVYRRAADTWGDLGDDRATARTLERLGGALLRLRRVEESIPSYQRAVDLHRKAGAPAREAETLNMLAFALQQAGRTDQCVDALNRAYTLYGQLGDRRGQEQVARNLTTVSGTAQPAGGRAAEQEKREEHQAHQDDQEHQKQQEHEEEDC